MVGRGVRENIGVGGAEVLCHPEGVYRDKLHPYLPKTSIRATAGQSRQRVAQYPVAISPEAVEYQ
jgi:hypothetical protein